MKPKFKLGIIDADSICYKIAFQTLDDECEEAIRQLDEYLFNNIHSHLFCKQYLICLSAGHSGRDEVAVTKPYKGNRAKLEKPIHLDALKDHLIDEYNALMVRPYEADDLVITAHDMFRSESVLIGIDKDNLQSQGWHFNYNKAELFEVSMSDAEYNLAVQLLTGDTGDNIPGLAKVGAKTAEKILDGKALPIDVAFRYYKENGYSDAYFMEQLTLLKMKKDIYVPFSGYFVELPDKDLEAFKEF